MKVLLTLSLVFLITFCTFSQLGSNVKFIDATVSYNSSVEKQEFAVNGALPQDLTNRNLTLDFSYGWSIKSDQLISVGLNTDINHFKFEFFDFTNTFRSRSETNSLYSLLLVYQKFYSIGKKILFTPTLSGSFGLGKVKYETDGNTLENDLLGFSFRLTPSFQYFLDEKWALTGSIGSIQFSRRIEKLELDGLPEDANNTDEDFGAFFGVNSFGLGVRYYLDNSTE